MKELTKKSARLRPATGQTSIYKNIYDYLVKRKRQRLKIEGLDSGNCWRVIEINKPNKRDCGVGDDCDDDDDDDNDYDDEEEKEGEENNYPCA